MNIKNTIQELRRDAKWLTADAVLDLIERRVYDAEKEAKEQEQKTAKPTQEEIDRIVEGMYF